MDCNYEVIFVNDGSRDDTAPILLNAVTADRRIKVLGFSRNFGHQAAITAGLDYASGDAVVVMDAICRIRRKFFPRRSNCSGAVTTWFLPAYSARWRHRPASLGDIS